MIIQHVRQNYVILYQILINKMERKKKHEKKTFFMNEKICCTLFWMLQIGFMTAKQWL